MRRNVIRSFPMLAVLALAFVSSLSACGTAEDQEQINPVQQSLTVPEVDTAETERPVLDGTAAVTVSFARTCNGADWAPYAGKIIAATASSCRRYDGSYTGRVSWTGSCTSDIANCNGVLRCGRC